jgi:hypothetical protein
VICGALTSEQKKEEKRSDKILYYHDLGLNNAEIAKLVDCSREYVRQVLSKCGIFSPVCWEKNKQKEYQEA